MPKSTRKKKVKKPKLTYSPGFNKYGAPNRPKNLQQRMGPLMRDTYGIPEDEDWMDYVEQDKKFKKIFDQQMKVYKNEYEQYVKLREKYKKSAKEE